MAAMSEDLVAFLHARIEEDEALATSGESWTVFDESVHGTRRVDVDFSIERVVACTRAWRAEHIARHDPVRVLAEVAAKRQLLVVCETAKRNADLPDPEGGYPPAVFVNGYASALDHAVRLAALPYADHPDYRQEWAPEA
jgi:hypothetical protein